MDPVKTYSYLALSRRRILDWTRPLTDAQYRQQFPIGPGSLARTLTHIMISEGYYIQRMREETVLPYAQWPIQDESPPAFAVLESEWVKQTQVTRAAIAEVRSWTHPVEYEVTNDAGKRIRVGTNRGDIFTQLILHEVHHRAQVMNMLRQHGVTLADIDYNELMYTRQEVPAL